MRKVNPDIAKKKVTCAEMLAAEDVRIVVELRRRSSG
jgi:hypothetical protein